MSMQNYIKLRGGHTPCKSARRYRYVLLLAAICFLESSNKTLCEVFRGREEEKRMGFGVPQEWIEKKLLENSKRSYTSVFRYPGNQPHYISNHTGVLKHHFLPEAVLCYWLVHPAFQLLGKETYLVWKFPGRTPGRWQWWSGLDRWRSQKLELHKTRNAVLPTKELFEMLMMISTTISKGKFEWF